MTGHDKFLDQVTALLPALRAFGRSLCGDPARADDLVQDTVLKAYQPRAVPVRQQPEGVVVHHPA